MPAEQVPDLRLKLAAQGLPKGGNVGFELLENQKLGVSQFVEQVNYQRSLEGELARSIQSLGSVAGARVHLALPKPSVFVRDQQKPTASVLLNLQSGRALDPAAHATRVYGLCTPTVSRCQQRAHQVIAAAMRVLLRTIHTPTQPGKHV